MELKQYQYEVLADIDSYIRCLAVTRDPVKAYNLHWDNKSFDLGKSKRYSYKDTFPGVPDVCLKVPTGGGKTFIACAALKKIFDRIPRTAKLVLWLVPSSAILEQTKKNLKDPNHPYRQRINADFQGRVVVYDVNELLNGQNFNLQSIDDQLSICVLSYSSTKTNNPENRRMYRQNGALQSFIPLTCNLDEEALGVSPSLMGVFNALSPVIVLDESHNAGSTLTKKALKIMNPSFILELTATPKPDSNIISIVSALALKKEHMMKIPLVVYGRPNVNHVIYTTIDYLETLQAASDKEREKSGRYVRPIALIQAQPNIDDGSVNYEKIRKLLIDAKIPEEQIGIKVSGKDTITGVDLLSPSCKIRYIITVNALKEGWDCPFAYVLASIARRSSETEVEQIIGRILRQPGASLFEDSILNMSYVITSSKVFNDTLQQVSKGLIAAGFSGKDYRAVEDRPLEYYIETGEIIPSDNPSSSSQDTDDNPGPDLDSEELNRLLDLSRNKGVDNTNQTESNDGHTPMPIDPNNAREQAKKFEEQHKDEKDEYGGDLMQYARKVDMKDEFRDDAEALSIPKFLYRSPNTLDNSFVLLEKDQLSRNIDILQMDCRIDFSVTDIDAGAWDLNSRGDEMAFSRFSASEFEEFTSTIQDVAEKQVSEMKRLTKKLVELIECNRVIKKAIPTPDLYNFVYKVVDSMSVNVFNEARKNPNQASNKIAIHIKGLIDGYNYDRFFDLFDVNRIKVDPNSSLNYKFPSQIDPRDTNNKSILYRKTLYERVQNVNDFEKRIEGVMDSCENVLWWHRVVENNKEQEFFLNGPMNHFPDFIARLKSGATVLIESKGGHLDNTNSKRKIAVGKAWESGAGPGFKYYMVFDDGFQTLDGSITISQLAGKLSLL